MQDCFFRSAYPVALVGNGTFPLDAYAAQYNFDNNVSKKPHQAHYGAFIPQKFSKSPTIVNTYSGNVLIATNAAQR